MDGLLLADGDIALATDLYQLTMAAGYHVAGADGPGDRRASFELFVRKLPRDRGYLVAAGLEQAVHGLLSLRFDGAAIDYLRGQSSFAAIPDSFFDRLAALRFTGDLDAIAEGTPVFPNEPLLRVEAPLFEAQLVETYLLTVVNMATLIATKAARVVQAADGRGVADFGTRRAHGPQAALYAARSAYLAGCVGTSNVLAGQRLGIPLVGTAAHSWTMAFGDEREAFAAYHRAFPEHALLLVDTYDTREGVRRAIELGDALRGVRLDSGDLGDEARESRAQLDAAGLDDALIVASGDLDEHRIAELVADGAPIDLFGVGTRMVVSRDAPALGGVYKLVELDGEPRVKCSPGKATYAGRKQVFRAADGSSDVLGLVDESIDGERLLSPVLREGALVGPLPPLEQLRARCAESVARLPEGVRALREPALYPVRVSDALADLTRAAASRWGS